MTLRKGFAPLTDDSNTVASDANLNEFVFAPRCENTKLRDNLEVEVVLFEQKGGNWGSPAEKKHSVDLTPQITGVRNCCTQRTERGSVHVEISRNDWGGHEIRGMGNKDIKVGINGNTSDLEVTSDEKFCEYCGAPIKLVTVDQN